MGIDDSKECSGSSEEKKKIINTLAKNIIYQRNEKVEAVLRPNSIKWSRLSQLVGRTGNSHYQSESVNLEKEIRKKVLGVVEKKDFPVGLYKKAAAAAEEKEKEFKNKTAALMTQIQKEDDFIKLVKRIK